MNRANWIIMAGASAALIMAGLISVQKANGVTLEAGGVEMTLDLADTGLQLKFASAG
ncbi:MAG: hypothetical protein V3V03_09410 [Hyphomonadaceae bacterium]